MTELDKAEQWLLEQLANGARRRGDLLKAGRKAGHTSANLYQCLWQRRSVVAVANGYWRRAVHDDDSGVRAIRCVYDPVNRHDGRGY